MPLSDCVVRGHWGTRKLGTAPAASSQACSAFCRSNSGCDSWSWTAGSCDIYGYFIETNQWSIVWYSARKSCVTTVPVNPDPSCALHGFASTGGTNVAFENNKLSYLECNMFCLASSLCEAWTYKPDPGKLYCKMEWSEYKPSPGSISGPRWCIG